ncbi:MAG: 2-isopropylmalate synthase, partial [Methanomassiliicoccaceae archaeon]|nr:2-isopropylmalate synthase [Methanomassiliicoccaceae archaeon]
VALGLYVNFGIETVDMSKIGSISRTVSRATGYQIPYNKPIVGRNAFSHESGIHVHGVLNNAATYEAFRPELVGMNRHIVLGKHSGTHSVKDRLNALKIKFPEERIPELLAKIKELAMIGKEIDDAELIAVVDHMMWKGGSETAVELAEFAVFTGKGVTATATVTVDIEGEKRTRSSTGIGPVDASINAIRAAVDENITLEEYRLNAITGGSDSLCEVTVIVKGSDDDNRSSVGKAVGLDIVGASVEATMEAINRYHIRGKRG